MFFGKHKIVVQDDRFNYFEDGKVEEIKRLFGNYLIIKVFKHGERGFSCKDKKPPAGFKYIFSYQAQEGKTIYCFTNTLNTSFLAYVLEKLKGKKNFLIKISPHLAILIFGSDVFVLYGDNENELKEKAESILQGFDYEEVNFEEILRLIKPKSNLTKYIVGLALIFFAIGGYYIYNEYFSEEAISQTSQSILPPPQPQNTEMQVKEKTEIQELPYEKTLYLLDLIKTTKLPPYMFLSDIDFDNYAVKIGSFIPLPDFQKFNNFYISPVILSNKIENALKTFHKKRINYKFKKVLANYPKCLTYLNSMLAVNNVGDNFISYTIEKIWDIDKTAKFLFDISDCPIQIRGNIRFSDLMHRVISLKIKLYLPNSLSY